MRSSVSDIARATGGECIAPWALDREVTGVCWDSRKVAAGDLYVALPGARVDGHEFCAAAVQAGAACMLVSREVGSDALDAARAAGAGVVHVADTFNALGDLARWWRGRLRGTVVAVTGSSGKTTTKNLISDVLSCAGSTVATEGNQNNELGVPATLLRAQEETRFIVVEMGMRGLGQLASLCSFVKPDWALVTNVGESHIELLGSRDNIARAKAEALAAVPEGGLAFINASDDYARELRAYGKLDEHGARVLYYDGSGGTGEGAQGACVAWASSIELDDTGCASFDMHLPGESARCSLSIPGAHNVHNACAAAAVGHEAGLSIASIVGALERARSVSGRQNVLRSKAGFTVVDDAYNANPDSMRASLAMFGSMKAAGRRIAVLGDMGELGSFSDEAHEQAGRWATAAGIDELVCVGPLAKGIAGSAVASGMDPHHVHSLADVEEAIRFVPGLVEEGDCVLVKASHSVGLDRLVERLVG